VSIVASEGWGETDAWASGFSISHEIHGERQWARGNQGETMFRPPVNIGTLSFFTDLDH
jgi:hypothetical protein